MVVNKNSHYDVWAFIRIFKQIAAYLLLFPVLLLFYPITAACNWLGRIFYLWK